MITNQWYAVLPSKEVKPNQITSVKRLNIALALFRNSKGVLGCVTDLCSHRGAALSKGEVKGDCIQCPFHGLIFDVTGKCRKVPAKGRHSLDDLTRFNVKSHYVREEHGMIYLWFGENKNATPDIPFLPLEDIWQGVYSEMEDLWNAHYSRVIENQLDVIHLPFIHHNTIGRGNKTLVNGPKVIVRGTSIITSANNENDYGQTPKSSADSTINDTYLHFVFPNTWMNHISEQMRVVIFFAPVDDSNTMLYIRFYTTLSKHEMVNKAIAFAGKYGNKIIERQDKRVVITQSPKASSYRSSENLLAGDLPVITYRKIRNNLKSSTTL